MRYTGIQPQYFPRLHYFARILQTDTFVIRDDVQFVRKHKYPDGKTGKSYQAHSPIKHASGTHFLLVPVVHDGYQSIVNTKIQYENDWIEQHLKTIQIFYSNAPQFSQLFPQIEHILKKKYSNLAELNITTIIWGLNILLDLKLNPTKTSLKEINQLLKKEKKIRLKTVLRGINSSMVMNNSNLTPNEKIISLIKEIGADEDYCGGTAVDAYMDRQLFKKNGIKIVVQQWESKEYPQLFSKHQPFIPNLSIIDLLMNVPRKEALAILTN